VTRATTILVLTAVCAAAGAGTAAAQTASPMGYVNIDVGAQPQRRTIARTSTFRIYDETATVEGSQRIRNGGMFDVGAGLFVTERLAVGLGYSMFGRPGTGVITASIPNPSVFNQLRTQTKDASELQHKEQTLHMRLSWMTPVSDSMEIAVSVGPSYVQLKQEITTLAIVTGTQDFGVNKVEESGHTIGINAGVDGNYMVSPSIGVGIFVHYVYGKLDLPSVPGFTVGGVQGGLGLHVRF
jgi:hypothetical protein